MADLFSKKSYYEYKKLYRKYFRSYFLVLFLIFILMVLVITTYVVTNSNKQLEEKMNQYAAEITAINDYNISAYNNIFNLISKNPDVVKFLQSYEPIDKKFSNMQMQSNISNLIFEQASITTNISEIIVYNKLNNSFISNKYGGIADKSTDEYWYKLVKKGDVYKVLIEYSNDLIYTVFPVEQGYIIISYIPPFDTVLGKFDSLYVYQTSNEKLIYASDDDIVPYTRSSTLKRNMLGSDYTISVKSNYWFTYIYQSHISTINNLSQFLIMLMIMMIILLTTIYIISYYQANSVYSNVASILVLLNCDNGDEKSFNEWNYIANNIISILKENDNYEQQNIAYIQELKDAHYIAMQNQLTPHFLFNTLSMINMSIQNTLHTDCSGTVMLTKLSELLRMLLDSGDNLISVSKEIDYSKKYIELEQIKHSNLICNFNISDKCYNYAIPKFSLQPLLENSIVHGMIPNEEMKINVSVLSHTESHFKVIIKDNGCGMNYDVLQKLKDATNCISDIKYSTGHIGFTNTIKRFSLIFASNFSCEIDSNDFGTEIVLYIPKNNLI